MDGVRFVVWKDEYTVGHPEMDSHHRNLIDIINTLYDHSLNGASEAQVTETIKKMDAYARLHFDAEEDVLTAAAYPNVDDQKRTHRAYTATLDNMRRSFFLPSGDLSQEILQFLKNWWLGHILKMDKEYGSFLQERTTKSEVVL